MSLRQFVWGERPSHRTPGIFSHTQTQTAEDSKKWTYENGIAVLRIQPMLIRTHQQLQYLRAGVTRQGLLSSEIEFMAVGERIDERKFPNTSHPRRIRSAG